MAQRNRLPQFDLYDYERPTTVSRFDSIRQPLVHEFTDKNYNDFSSLTTKELSQFIGQFQKFQEEALGRNAPRSNTPHPTKVPAKLFKLDPAPTTKSPIYHILRAAYEFRASKKWRRWDWSNAKEMVEMVSYVRDYLVNEGIIKNPMIKLGESVERIRRQELIEQVHLLGGRITRDNESATHVIHYTNDNDDTDEEWFRTLEKKSGRVLVHWWYYPDSYDMWLEETAEHADPEPMPEHKGPWNVSERWLTDSVMFNEWMNEEDYEISDTSDFRRLSAGDDQSGISESETSPIHKRNLDSMDSPLQMEIDARPTVGAKRARIRSPERDILPEHPSVSLVDIEIEANRVGGVRSKKNELDPIAGGEIANISQSIPVDIRTETPHEAFGEENPEAIEDNTEMDNITSDLNDIRIPNDTNNMDVDMLEREQTEPIGDNISPKRNADSPTPVVKEVDEDEQMGTPEDSKQQDDNINDTLPETVVPDATATNSEEEKKRLEEEARKYLSQQTQEIIIPSYAAWFDMAKIHSIEQKSLPEFFNNRNKSKTPSIYKEYRDFIINTYRLNPGEYLTVTACRRNLAGDVCAIIRIHAFLEQWGLINYQVDPDTRPSSVGPPFTGHFRVSADTPRGLQPFHPSTMSLSTSNLPNTASTINAGPSDVTVNANVKMERPISIRQNVYQSALATDAGSQVSQDDNASAGIEGGANEPRQYNCCTCGVDCTRVRYHSLKTQNFELCSNCYLEGRYPTTMYSGDFLKMDDTPFKHAQDDDWSEQETLALLEGVELYEDDWHKISEHVGTRTREQCILHFLEFPIEDPLNNTTISDLGPLQYQRIPFSQADNPIMSVVAFLASVVNPGVAAAAAKSALKELSSPKVSDKSKEINGIKDTKTGEPAETSDTTPLIEIKHEDAMDTEEGSSDLKLESSSNTATASDATVGRPKLLERAGATAMGAAAAKAKVLADYEEREIQRLVNAVIENQLKKLELKLQQFEELEVVLENEKRDLEKQRQLLFNERLSLKKNSLTMQEQLRNSQAGGSKQPLSSSDHWDKKKQTMNPL
ncbi:8582_t:CDS:2 [Funneliformis caledonium]|uniref:8582_t:CDS:1 n=1 Tax=Funneliformis caledonium TaxID=1117310 RepID=A0A9N9GCI7_9GLOM|nr:8582_t:CDS:2 [Funneliformis caledonium]